MENIKWTSRKAPSVQSSEVGEAPLRMPPLMWKWLAARGFVSLEQINEFLTPSLSKIEHPFTMSHLEQAAVRLAQAHAGQEPICVYGDYDLDGSTGISLLVAGLKGLGFKNVSHYQPSRFLEGYGIHREALDVIAKRGDKIVISVDCGITALDEAKYARKLGLDLIITDHHLPRQNDGVVQLPECLAVVNPNRGNCTSFLSHLSGVGVGFYLLLGVKSQLKDTNFDLKSLLDLFAIGTISDMVPLKKENRVLVKHGLKLLSRTQRPGLQALIQRLNLTGRDLDSTDVAFSIAPKLNALSRLELEVRPLDVLMCENLKDAQVLAERVMDLNSRRKLLQTELEEKISKQLPQVLDKPVIVLAAPGHAGVVSLVATKIAQLTGKPAFIVAWHEGEGIGSARGQETDCLPEGLAKAASILERYGGHAQAAGFSLKSDRFEALKAALEAHYSQKTQNAVVIEQIYDVEAKLSEINENFMNWLKHAGPFGIDNPPPLLKINETHVTGVRWMKDQHLKLVLSDGSGRAEAMAFFAKGKYHVETGEKVELLVEPSWNFWQGQKRLQLLIRGLKPVSH
jgi:single-stranded-DNA-specific exonuclease